MGIGDKISNKAEELKGKVKEAEEALNQYEKEHPDGVSLEDQTDVTGTRYKELNQRYMDAEAQVLLSSL